MFYHYHPHHHRLIDSCLTQLERGHLVNPTSNAHRFSIRSINTPSSTFLASAARVTIKIRKRKKVGDENEMTCYSRSASVRWVVVGVGAKILKIHTRLFEPTPQPPAAQSFWLTGLRELLGLFHKFRSDKTLSFPQRTDGCHCHHPIKPVKLFIADLLFFTHFPFTRVVYFHKKLICYVICLCTYYILIYIEIVPRSEA